MSFRFDPDGDPTQTTPAAVKLSYEHLQGQIATQGNETRNSIREIKAQLKNGQTAFDEIRGRLDSQDAQIADLRKEMEGNTILTADSYALSQMIFAIARPIGRFFNAVGVVTEPIRWVFRQLAKLSEKVKWLIALLASVSASYAAFKGWFNK